ncbi:hypothetical protein FH972_016955 [Carpinus fangiana]|uniref:Uncharacterized protein n=1 Tax=Carpinus fangiana TaxID=176857 RepID=A0A5N6RL99_9ROSI|nr:hypothetical protein FH972_016955 [Carpinus fangiana]
MGCRRRWLDGRYVVIWAVGRFGWCDLGGVRFGRCGDLGLWRDLGMVRSGWARASRRRDGVELCRQLDGSLGETVLRS